MPRMPPRIAPAILIPVVLLLAGCAARPANSPTFADIQAQQAAIQTLLTAGEAGTTRTWRGPDGASGTATLKNGPDSEGCRTVETTGPGGAVTDTWCPTPHGFWVHPDERFYRNATGHKTYGGAVRSRGAGAGAGDGAGTDIRDDRPEQIDCLRLLNDERRLSDDGRESAARAARRAFHRCLHRSE